MANKFFYSLTVWVVFSLSVMAQDNTFYFTQTTDFEAYTWQTIQLEHPITSFAFSYTDLPKDFKADLGNELVNIQADLHLEKNLTHLTVLPQSTNTIRVFTGNLQGRHVLHGIYVPPLKANQGAAYRTEAVCNKPNMVLGSTWRAGLPNPANPPSPTKTTHIIVHHTSGSNTATNYTEVVRNIFVFHTQGNGWNDVGYNYLIAQNGDIYEGRSGQNQIDVDNVTGAHFCGFNSGTMGICLLGNYEATGVQPTEAMLKSLAQLIAWKMGKENMTDPTARTFHPASNRMLNVVSGHRDGCATDCPGQNVYSRLAQIRASIFPNGNCPEGSMQVTANENALFAQSIRLFPQPAQEELWVKSPEPIQKITLIDLAGKTLRTWQNLPTETLKISTAALSQGLYLLHIESATRQATKKIVIE